MKRITRPRRLSPQESAKYQKVRAQIAEELPGLIDRYHQRTAVFDQVQDVLHDLKAAREKRD